MQRLVTRSRFDHVGLVIRSYTQELTVAEATFHRGVSMFTWRDFIELNQHIYYNQVVWRQLTYNKARQHISNFIYVGYILTLIERNRQRIQFRSIKHNKGIYS